MADTTEPVLGGAIPPNGATGVSTRVTLSFVLDDLGVGVARVTSAAQVTVPTLEPIVVAGVVQVGWTGTVELTPDGRGLAIVVTRDEPLEPSTLYIGSASTEDNAGNYLDYDWSFTTGGTAQCTAALGRLIAQYRGKPKLEGTICALVDPFDDLDAAGLQCRDLRALDTACGAQLDGLGEIVGQAREGMPDTIYRRFLAGRIALNKSTGMTPELGAILEALLAGDSAIRVERHYPATTVLRVVDPIDIEYAEASAKLLREAPPAGTRLILEYLPPSTPLWVWAEWGSDPAPATPLAEWGEDPAPGGVLAEATDGEMNEV